MAKRRKRKKKCSKCGKVKSRNKFYKDKNKKDGLNFQCVECLSKYYFQDKGRNKYYMRTYGITVDDYNKMLKDQDGVCAICGTDNPQRKGTVNFAIDHCHETGKIRGLLCSICNRLLGDAEDDIEILELAIKYLREYSPLIGRKTRFES